MTDFELLVNNVREDYKSYRRSGKNRIDAIGALKTKYDAELKDDDEAAFVMSGIVRALCEKKELTEEIAEEMLAYINKNAIDKAPVHFQTIRQMLYSPKMYGKEATYRRKIPYIPNWEKGDLFAHTMTHPAASKVGIEGWIILFYKVGEYIDENHLHRQLMLVSICPPGKEPTSSLELQNLGFLRMMCHGKKWDYLVQIVLKNKKDEFSYGLTKIANFTDVAYPSDGVDENPLLSMPMFGLIKKGEAHPHYEEHICRLYRKQPKRTAL